jgi:hypothetical protein
MNWDPSFCILALGRKSECKRFDLPKGYKVDRRDDYVIHRSLLEEPILLLIL